MKIGPRTHYSFLCEVLSICQQVNRWCLRDTKSLFELQAQSTTKKKSDGPSPYVEDKYGIDSGDNSQTHDLSNLRIVC